MTIVKEFPFQVVLGYLEYKFVVTHDTDDGSIVINLVYGKDTYEILSAFNDQWGIWFDVNKTGNVVVAWEVGTLSFLEAYANAIAYMREAYQC